MRVSSLRRSPSSPLGAEPVGADPVGPFRSQATASCAIATCAFASCAVALLLCPVRPARALDVQIDSTLAFQVYEVRAPGTTTFLARRRLTANLGFRLSQPIGDPEPDGRQIRLSSSARLRIDHDFGQDCLIGLDICLRATNADASTSWQPLSQLSLVDLPHAWVAVDGLPYGLETRVGRQLEASRIGFVRFDGASARFAPFDWIALEAFGGLSVRATTLLGTGQFELPGTMRVDRGQDADPRAAVWAAPPTETWVAGVRLRGGPGRWLQASLEFREMWEPSGLVLRRLGLDLSSEPLAMLRLTAGAVLDLVDDTVIDGSFAGELRQSGWAARAAVERHVPRFDPGSIWAWFYTAPVDQARLGGSLGLSDDVGISLDLRGRRAELPDHEEYDAGLEGSLSARVEGVRSTISGFVWSGSLGPNAGIAVDARRRILREVSLGAQISVWYFDAPWRENLSGAVVSETLDSEIQLVPEASVRLEFSHAVSDAIGHRFRLIGWLRVETWR